VLERVLGVRANDTKLVPDPAPPALLRARDELVFGQFPGTGLLAAPRGTVLVLFPVLALVLLLVPLLLLPALAALLGRCVGGAEALSEGQRKGAQNAPARCVMCQQFVRRVEPMLFGQGRSFRGRDLSSRVIEAGSAVLVSAIVRLEHRFG
jgi:hypothetical protein